jgi:exopolysaccharide biosynthesis polyprenyl glycosylphosphotransferase
VVAESRRSPTPPAGWRTTAPRPRRTAPRPGAVGDHGGPAGRDGARRIRAKSWEIRYVRRLLAADVVVGFGAGMIAFQARFGSAVTEYNWTYLILSAMLPFALIAALAANRAYERRFLFVGTEEYQRMLRAGLALTAAVALISYALDIRLSRGYLVVALPLATTASIATRFAMRRLLHRARAGGQFLRRVVAVGHPQAVADLTQQLRRERFHGLDVVGGCLPPGVCDGLAGVDLPVVGSFDAIDEAVAATGADTVIVLSCPELDGLALRRLAWQLEGDDVDLILASALIDVAGERTTIRPVDGLPLLHVDHPRLAGAGRVVKAVFDWLGAAVLICCFLPLLVLVAVAVKLDSPGPVIFRQVRVGKGGREFAMFKFRSMRHNADAYLAQLRARNDSDGVLFKMRDDPRVTRVGRWLRRYSVDELPQLFNVLRGQMSLVGPRPPLPSEVAVYPDDLRRRLAVKPGMTGLWQVSGRSDLPWEEAVRLDLRYVENWTLTMDLAILLRTVSAVLRSSGAY